MRAEANPKLRGRPEVTIWTDGCAWPNPGRGGWACVLLCGYKRKELSGYCHHATNNQMELTAAIRALQALKTPCLVTLYTDSQYLQRGASQWLKAWKRRGLERKLNSDLWQEIDRLCQIHQVTWKWVRGHSGHRENEHCDQLAEKARLDAWPPAYLGLEPQIAPRPLSDANSPGGRSRTGSWVDEFESPHRVISVITRCLP